MATVKRMVLGLGLGFIRRPFPGAGFFVDNLKVNDSGDDYLINDGGDVRLINDG